MLKIIPCIVVSVLLSAFAQLFLRKGMLSIGNFGSGISEFIKHCIAICTNMYIILGMLSFGLSVVLWLYVLTKVNVSIAYPFQCVGYIIVALIAFYTMGEPLSLQKLAGIAIICVGVAVLSFSPDAL